MIPLLISSLFFFIYCLYFFWFFMGVFPKNGPKKTVYFLASAIVLAVQVLSYLYLNLFGVALILIAVVFVFKVFFHKTNEHALYGGSFCVLSIYSSRAIFAAIYSFILNKDVNLILTNPYHFNSIIVLSVLLSILILSIIKHALARQKSIMKLLTNKRELRYFIVYQMLLIMLFLLINDGRIWVPQQTWYSTLYLMAGIMIKIIVIIILRYAVRLSLLIEYESQSKHLQSQLDKQVQHYKSYQVFVESFRKFDHDYKNMMGLIKTLISNHKFEEATQLIDDIQDSVRNSVKVQYTYSNNFVIDAILLDAANACQKSNVDFSGAVPFPQYAAISSIHAIKIFTNLLNNALDACNKVNDGNRYIKISSTYNQTWFYLNIVNSYDGEQIFNGLEIETTKEKKHLHGFGLKIVRETIEDALSGLMKLETDQERKECRVQLCLPIESLKRTDDVTP